MITVADIGVMKMKPEEAIETIKTALAEVEWEYPMDYPMYYAAAFDMAIEALEKQVPKKPRETRCALMCANCGHKITEKGCKKLNRNYCKKCGQRILWEVEK